MVSLPIVSIDCRFGAARREGEGVARSERCPETAANVMQPPRYRKAMEEGLVKARVCPLPVVPLLVATHVALRC
jgi:hypothetical protein